MGAYLLTLKEREGELRQQAEALKELSEIFARMAEAAAKGGEDVRRALRGRS